MTAAADRRVPYVDTLRQLADLTDSGVLPMPVSPVMVSFWFLEGQGGREAAAVAAEALGGDWRPGTVSTARRYLRAVSTRPGIELSIYLDTGDPEADDEPTPPPAAVAFAADLNTAAGAEDQS